MQSCFFVCANGGRSAPLRGASPLAFSGDRSGGLFPAALVENSHTPLRYVYELSPAALVKNPPTLGAEKGKVQGGGVSVLERGGAKNFLGGALRRP